MVILYGRNHKAVCISEKRGTVKKNINEVNVIKDFGLEGDAHAGKWHRQVSFLSADIGMNSMKKVLP